MSRRNGVSVASSIADSIRELYRPGASMSNEVCLKILKNRRGWSHVKGNLFQFKTGDRLEWKKGTPFEDVLSQVTSIEVRPLGHGLPPEVQEQLMKDAVEAAAGWWRKNGPPFIISS